MVFERMFLPSQIDDLIMPSTKHQIKVGVTLCCVALDITDNLCR